MAQPGAYRDGMQCNAPAAAPTDCPNTAAPAASRPTAAANATTTSSREPGVPASRSSSRPRREEYQTDAYRVYNWLPANRHQAGKGGSVNRN